MIENLSLREKPFVIGITGGSGSGKTTVLRELARGFGPGDLSVMSMDNYYKSREEQEYDDQGVQNFDIFSSIDTEAFYQDILVLINGKPVSITEYGFNNHHHQPNIIRIEPAPVLILEGIFLFHMSQLDPIIDLKIFVEAKDAIKIIRRITRDKNERNYPVDDVLYRYAAHVVPAYEQYIAPYKERADIIINNNDKTGSIIKVIRSFLHWEVQQKGKRSNVKNG